ncbi:MAG: CDP-glucose 4,6-dehydratase [Nitrososphaerota archaeon]|nr:CDP-glucose 4,6-dehydratase [Nitrososphaerota archaeon]
MINSIARDFYRGKRVFITGQTGFIGSWLTECLLMLGAKVFGYSLPPPTLPNLYSILDIKNEIESTTADVRDSKQLSSCLTSFTPEIVFHLAAQPIVIRSYELSSQTFETNLLGTVNVLDQCRYIQGLKAVVVVTSDKTYKNKGLGHFYKESDELGGVDPYSASKSCADIALNSYRESFYKNQGIGLSAARGGNVIGGGDWGEHRIVPDIVRAITGNRAINVRNPTFIRPWQHVMEFISGLLTLGERLSKDFQTYSLDYNFGPVGESITVLEIVNTFIEEWGKGNYVIESSKSQKEEAAISLDIGRANSVLNWKPTWQIDKAINKTVEWYKEYFTDGDVVELTKLQINDNLMQV